MPANDKDFWNGRFASESYVFGTRPAAFLADNAHSIPPRSRVLVPADGEGRNSVFLAETGHRVVATDIAEAGIAKARKLADTRGVSVEFRHLDLRGWQWPEAEFDAVVAELVAGRLRVPVDSTFPIARGRDALRHLESGAHFGKVVLEIGA